MDILQAIIGHLSANTMKKALADGWLATAQSEKREPRIHEAVAAGVMTVLTQTPDAEEMVAAIKALPDATKKRLIQTLSVAIPSLGQFHMEVSEEFSGQSRRDQVFDLLGDEAKQVVESGDCQHCPLHDDCVSPDKEAKGASYAPVALGPNEAKIREILSEPRGPDTPEPVATPSGAILH